MTDTRQLIDGIRIASPCHAAWDQMTGDDRVRFCDACRMNVYDLSAMSLDEAARIVESREGRVCVRFYRRPDGTVLTRDCPVGLRWIRTRFAAAAALIAALLGGFAWFHRNDARQQGSTSPNASPPMGALSTPLRATMGEVEMGDVALPSQPPTVSESPPTLGKLAPETRR